MRQHHLQPHPLLHLHHQWREPALESWFALPWGLLPAAQTGVQPLLPVLGLGQEAVLSVFPSSESEAGSIAPAVGPTGGNPSNVGTPRRRPLFAVAASAPSPQVPERSPGPPARSRAAASIDQW